MQKSDALQCMTPKEYYREKETGAWNYCVSITGTHANLVSVYCEQLSSSEEEEADTELKETSDSDSDFEPKGKINKRKGSPLLEAPRRSKRRVNKASSKTSSTKQTAVSSTEQSEPVASSSAEQPEPVDLSAEQPEPVASSSVEQSDEQPESAASSDEEAAASSDQEPAASSAQEPAASSAQEPASAEDPVPLITAPCHDGNPDDETAVVQSHDQDIPADKLEARHVVHQPEKYCLCYTFVFILKQTCLHNDTFVSLLNHICLHNDTFAFIIK